MDIPKIASACLIVFAGAVCLGNPGISQADSDGWFHLCAAKSVADCVSYDLREPVYAPVQAWVLGYGAESEGEILCRLALWRCFWVMAGLCGWMIVAGWGRAGLATGCCLLGAPAVWVQMGLAMPSWVLWFGVWPWAILLENHRVGWLRGWCAFVHPSGFLLLLGRRRKLSLVGGAGILIAVGWYVSSWMFYGWPRFGVAGGLALPFSHWHFDLWVALGVVGAWRSCEAWPWLFYGGRWMFAVTGMAGLYTGHLVARQSVCNYWLLCVLLVTAGVSWNGHGLEIHPGGYLGAWGWSVPSVVGHPVRKYEGCREAWLYGTKSVCGHGFPEGGNSVAPSGTVSRVRFYE